MIKLATLLKGEGAILFSISDLLLRVLPTYNLVAALTSGSFDQLLREEGKDYFSSALDFHYLGEYLVMTLLSTIAIWVLTYFIETRKQDKRIVIA